MLCRADGQIDAAHRGERRFQRGLRGLRRCPELNRAGPAAHFRDAHRGGGKPPGAVEFHDEEQSGEGRAPLTMPIYEYICNHCGNRFEKLVSSWNAPAACPACHAAEVEKQLSTFACVTGSQPRSGKPCEAMGLDSSTCDRSSCACGLN